MLNNSGISKTTYGMTKQILANVGLQSSVGCIVPQSLGVEVGNKKIAKAGTPIVVNTLSLNTPVVGASEGSPMNAVLLHDVDVTNGNANGTALLFGFVDVAKLDAEVATKLKSLALADNASKLIVLMSSTSALG